MKSVMSAGLLRWCTRISFAATRGKINVDVILLDQDLGEQEDGFNFLDSLSTRCFAGNVLFVTAGMSDEETRTAFERGVAGIFLEHSSPGDLLTAIRRVAAGEQWLDPKAVQSLGSRPKETNPTHERTPVFNPREQSVLDYIYSGLTNKEIAVKLDISEGYVKAVLQQLFAKTGVRPAASLCASRWKRSSRVVRTREAMRWPKQRHLAFLFAIPEGDLLL